MITKVSWHQKGRTILDLNEARDKMMGWQWQQLDHMQTICTCSRQMTTPAHHSNFYGPVALPDTQPCQSTN